MHRPGHCVKYHTENKRKKLPASSYHRTIENEIIRRSKDVTVHLLPARVFANYLYAFYIKVLALGVTSEVVSQGPKKNQSDETAQKHHHHETVEDTKPMDLMLEKVILQVAVEPRLEWLQGLLPVNRIRETQFSAHFHWYRILRGQVHFDNPVVVVSYSQTPMREDMLYKRF